MNKYLMVALLVLIAGCTEDPNSTSPPPTPEVNFQAADERLSISNLGDNDYGHWRLVELKYGGRKHVFIQHYDSNNQGFVKVGEYGLQTEISESP